MKNSQNHECGFDIAVLTHESEANPTQGEASRFREKGIKPRLFLISKDADKSAKRNNTRQTRGGSKKRTVNRKRVTHNDAVTVNGRAYKVNAEKSGLYVETIESMIEQFQIASSKWGRALVLRFDLHQDYPTDNNSHITGFRKRLFQKLKREYGFTEIGFCWVREQERSKSQHYHWVLFLDGNKIRHSSRINEMIKNAWEKPTGGYHVPVIKRPFYFVNDEQGVQDAIYRASYLAKARGKGYRPPQTKDFQCSRMRL